jgi:protein phosphatase 1 regulatory subunit 37
MCRDILNSCVRNTEEAEKNSHMTSPMGESGRGLGKGVWGMIEESKLAKTIRKGEKEMVWYSHLTLGQDDPESRNLQMSPDIIQQARACVEEFKGALVDVSASSPGQAPDLSTIATKAKTLILELTKSIETTNDPVRLEELLNANDELISFSEQVPESVRPTLKLHGLGLDIGDDRSLTPNNGNAAGDAVNVAFINGNGQVFHDSPVEEEEPTTPRVDKGKARAKPEPEEQEKVLSTNFLITESESEDEDGSRSIVVPCDFNERPSPTDR